ncbi:MULTISPECIES: hypothetical protein [unclassified Acidovorax]|uniref:Ppx/GppA phosphatase family protein n=1 Tax=unclassified Acidovorax TaxID=2684926 RepID=UPI00288324C2|nr:MULTISPECIES: hypothetical protein [unclassified Acidovorax]
MPSTAPAPLSADDAGALYAALQAGPLAGTPVTTLRIGGAHTTLASGSGPQARVLRSLPIGARATAAVCFSHQPPTGAELEAAIALVEEAVMPVRPLLADQSALFTADSGIRQVAIAAGLQAQPEMQLTLDAVERTFERLVAVSLGQPATHGNLPGDAAFAATLLILRETMQHLGFATIVIRSDAVV